MLYANGWPSIVKSQVLKYADDVKIWWDVTGDVDSHALQKDFYFVMNWFKMWFMHINAAKCVYTHVGNAKLNRYSLGEESVPVLLSIKHLRVTESHKLKTTVQCRELVAKRLSILWSSRQTFTKLGTNMFTIVCIILEEFRRENFVRSAGLYLKMTRISWEKCEG